MEALFKISPASKYGDIQIEWDGELEEFGFLSQFIGEHLPEWIDAKTPSVWIHLSGKNLMFAGNLTEIGFEPRRVEGEILHMNRWLLSSPSTLPPGPYAFLGAGAFVQNSQGKILAVRDRLPKGPGHWKLPGGLYEPSKDGPISDASVRECFEETGVRATFDRILFERLIPKGGIYDAPDVYIVSKLIPVSEEINFDPLEIAECSWQDPEVLLHNGHPIAQEFIKSCVYSTVGLGEQSTGSGDFLSLPLEKTIE